MREYFNVPGRFGSPKREGGRRRHLGHPRLHFIEAMAFQPAPTGALRFGLKIGIWLAAKPDR